MSVSGAPKKTLVDGYNHHGYNHTRKNRGKRRHAANLDENKREAGDGVRDGGDFGDVTDSYNQRLVPSSQLRAKTCKIEKWGRIPSFRASCWIDLRSLFRKLLHMLFLFRIGEL